MAFEYAWHYCWSGEMKTRNFPDRTDFGLSPNTLIFIFIFFSKMNFFCGGGWFNTRRYLSRLYFMLTIATFLKFISFLQLWSWLWQWPWLKLMFTQVTTDEFAFSTPKHPSSNFKKNHYSFEKCFFSEKRHLQNSLKPNSKRFFDPGNMWRNFTKNCYFLINIRTHFISYDPPYNRQNFEKQTSDSDFPLPTRFLQPLLIRIICSKIVFP